VYHLLLYVHVICAVIWVGGAFFLQLLAIRAESSTDITEIPRLTRTIEAIGNRVFVPAAGLLLLSGGAMTVSSWSFGRTWIAVSVALWVVSAVAGAVYLAPRLKKAVRLFDAEGPDSPRARLLIERMFLVSRLELISFAAILALMVFKPSL